jgi:hypothetical protein
MQDILCVVVPIPDHAFLSRRFSSVGSAAHSFEALASRRKSLTSSVVAARRMSFTTCSAGRLVFECFGWLFRRCHGGAIRPDSFAVRLGKSIPRPSTSRAASRTASVKAAAKLRLLAAGCRYRGEHGAIPTPVGTAPTPPCRSLLF